MREFSAPHFRPAAPGRQSLPKGRVVRNASPRTLNIGYQAQADAPPRVRPKSVGRRLRPNRGSELLAAMAVVVLFAVCGTVYFCAGLLSVSKDTIHNNIYIDGVGVGGKTPKDAITLVMASKGRPDMGLAVMLDGRKWVVSADDIGAYYDVNSAAQQAFAVGHQGDVLRRLSDILALRVGRRDIASPMRYDADRLKAVAGSIAQRASRPKVDAGLQFLPDSEGVFAYTDEVSGNIVNADALYAAMKTALDGGEAEITFSSSAMEPDITKEALRERTQLLGTYTTAMSPDALRNNNIALAGEAVNGSVIFPGETFSFNERTGERTKDRGYQDAPAIMSSQLVDAPGGGVCQVSSTVYNAALLAGLDVVERHHHTWPVSYVPAGFDSTVDWASGKDLKITNKTAQPIYLVFQVDGKSALVTAEFYGLPQADSITLEAEGYEILTPEKPLKYGNPNKPIGWSRDIVKARNGCKVTLYRTITIAGKPQRTLLYTDTYPTQRGEIEIGTKPPPEPNK